MPPSTPDNTPLPPVWATFRRFLPYLWPADAPALLRRVSIAMLLVVIAKVISLAMPFAYKAAIDRMAPGMEPGVTLAIALVVAYAGARFGSVLFDNLRNAVFERVGQEAGRRLSDDVFVHLHRLSLRFHLDRRTGAVTKIVERGTKSIDTMLYFLLFNIAPTVLELANADYPKTFNKHAITPFTGRSLLPVLTGSGRSEPMVFYNEHFRARYIRNAEWKLVSLDTDTTWRLYRINEDETELTNLSAQHPDIVNKMAIQWREWAVTHQVYPKPSK